MNHKSHISLIVFIHILFFTSATWATEHQMNQPNIIFMLSDDQDWTGLSVPMHPDMDNSQSDFYQTPNIDKLAHQGVRFSDAYAPAPVCSPTRYSLLTGKSTAQTGSGGLPE